MASDAPEQPSDSAVEELFDHAEPVRLVDWGSFAGPKTSVVLLATVAVVAFVSGLSHLSQGQLELAGPLGDLFPGADELLRLYGVFFAFLLGALTVGLRRRLKIAFYGVLVALPLVALVPLFTAAATDVPLFLLSGITALHLFANRGEFDTALDLSTFQKAAIAAFVGAQVYGTVGAYALREEFVGIQSLTDAFYYIIVTGTTVGYGDATPTTQLTKLFALSVIVLGAGTFTVASGSLLIPAIESRITSAFGNMTASELTLLEDHVLVLGYGDLTEPLLNELAATEDVVVVTNDADAAAGLRERDVTVLTADPTESTTLLDARIDAAAGVVVATGDDAGDVLAVLAARQADDGVRIVAAATDDSHAEKLEGVGADRVISPTVIGGRLLGRAVVDAESELDDVLGQANRADRTEADADEHGDG